MKKRITMVALSAALLMAAGTALAQPPMMAGGGMRPQMQGGGMVLQNLLPMLRHADLSEEQMDRLREIMEHARERMETIRGAEDHEGARERLMELFFGSSMTVLQVEEILDERLQKMEEMNEVLAEALVEIHGMLTPEQRAALADFEGEMPHGGHMEHAPMPHGSRGGTRPRR